MQLSDFLRNNFSVNFTTDNVVEIVSEDFSGKKIRKLTFDEFAECILASKGIVENQGGLEYNYSGILPNTNGIETLGIKMGEKSDTSIYIMKKTPKNITLEYYEDKFKIKKLPTIIMAVKVANGKAVKGWACAVKDKRITNESKVYKFPLANVFGDTSICWGGNRITEIEFENNSDIARLPAMFLSMPFNDHNYSGANKSKLPFRKLLEYLTENDFDEDWLIDTKMNYGSWVNTNLN